LPPPLWQLENAAVFSRACHAFGDGNIPHIAIGRDNDTLKLVIFY
jgi:hypothetical protein